MIQLWSPSNLCIWSTLNCTESRGVPCPLYLTVMCCSLWSDLYWLDKPSLMGYLIHRASLYLLPMYNTLRLSLRRLVLIRVWCLTNIPSCKLTVKIRPTNDHDLWKIRKQLSWCQIQRAMSNPKWEYPWLQSSWGQHGAHLGPTGPRWSPCWPHEPCYLGYRFRRLLADKRFKP